MFLNSDRTKWSSSTRTLALLSLARLAGLFFAFLLTSGPARAQVQPGSLDFHWDEGSQNCAAAAHPPLQVHPYNGQTFILREGLCTTFEAPFLYLLVGSSKALLIDTGDIADPNVVPLADTVMHLLPEQGSSKLPLLVVHTHRHLDHRAGDPQFAQMPNVEVVGFDLDSVRRYYQFANWPQGIAQIDLGNRIVDALPTPGHNETEVSFYDRNTALFFSGDFLLPGRLLVDDAAVDLASAERAASFVQARPVAFVLGGHIEMNSAGQLFPWESQFHPQERVLQMTKDDLLALPAALRSFIGFYSVHGQFTMENSIRILIALALFAIAVLVAMLWLLVRLIRRKRRQRVPAL